MDPYFKDMYFNRKGEPIGIEEAGRLSMDLAYKVVAQEDVLTSDGDLLWVSTVWLGLNHNYFRDGPPLIFETMVFQEGMDDEYLQRYPTEESALEGHRFVVHALKEGLSLYDDVDAEEERDHC